jgi:sensor histidine kinase regulating citrate/malate metabolism
MGIGLAFCKTSMERIGGDVRLMKSTPNGTIMQIVVPTKIPTTAHQS